jgi:hypothetical protein
MIGKTISHFKILEKLDHKILKNLLANFSPP